MRSREILECICKVPQHIIKLHSDGVHNSAEFLLHHLAMPTCFNLLQAAYFVDNPDFNFLKGVAGFHAQELFIARNHWQEQERFSKHMATSSFNQKVKAVERPSLRRSEIMGEKKELSSIAQDLGVKNPFFKQLPIKYDNIGIMIFEPVSCKEHAAVDHHLDDSLFLLGFTPLF